MVSIIPHGKDVSVVHLNADYGYLTYIEKCQNKGGEPEYRVVKVPLEGDCNLKRGKE